MAEKPRIKEKDAILDSLSAKNRASKAPSVVQSDILPPPIEHVDLTTQMPELSEEKRRGRPRKYPYPSQPEPPIREVQPTSEAPVPPPPPEPLDRNPLDFSKYELPQNQKEKRRGRPRKGEMRAWNPPELEEDEGVFFSGQETVLSPHPMPPPAAPLQQPSAAQVAAPAEKPRKPILRAGEVQAKEFAFSDLEEEQRREEEERAKQEARMIQRALDREEQRERAEVELLRREAQVKAEHKLRVAAAEANRTQQEAEAEAERLNREAEILAESKRRAAEEEAARVWQEAELKHRLAEEEAERRLREAEEEAERIRQEAETRRQAAAEEAERVRRATERARQEVERKRRAIEEEADREQRQAEAEAARLRREAQRQAARLKQQADEEVAQLNLEVEHKAERIRLEKESRRKLLVDEEYQKDVLGKLGDAFEAQFLQKFSQDGMQLAPEPEPEPEPKPEEKPWWQVERKDGADRQAAPQAFGMAIESQDEEIPPVFPPESVQEEPPLWHPPEFENTQSDSDVFENQSETPSSIHPMQEREAEQEADHFLRMFTEEVRQEDSSLQPEPQAEPELEQEPSKEETFHDALAEKFMRERERYLQDLGIAQKQEAEREAEAQRLQQQEAERGKVVPQHRKLDFQIRPEMHMQPGGMSITPPATPAESAPVTYNRAAQAKPQTLNVEIGPEVAGDVIAPETPGQADGEGKKTAEQLLFELGEQNRRRTVTKTQKRSQKQFKFRFIPLQGGDGDGEASGWRFPNPLANMTRMGKMVTISACAGLLAVTLLAWGILQLLKPLEESILPGTTDLVDTEEAGLLTRYESFNPENMTTFSDVSIKRSGLTVSNLTVLNRFVIEEDAKAEGSMTLDNVIVGDYIYVKNSGVNRLDLRNVQAERVIINNPSADVAIVTSGDTDIGAVEIRTPSTIEQGELLVEAAGIRSVQVLNEEGTEPLTLDVDKAQLSSMSTTGAAQLSFTEANVDVLSANGDLNLIGSGRVEELNFGLNTGGGATSKEPTVAFPVSLLVKGVEIGHLNLKSPANLNLSAQVDMAYIADPVILGGNSTVSHLIVNEKFGNARLPIDIYGVSIQQLTANAEALIYVNDSAMINTLTANASVWALGNKVNMLKANADNVIYENEPDSKLIGQGVDPPQSKEENPNLDYSLNYDFSADSGQPSIDATGDNVSTTCEHSRDSGGFVLGDGSRTNPFVVETVAQLVHVAEHADSYFIQVADIDISEDSSYADGFPMIGEYGEQFTGIYDGAGFTIENLRIYSDGENAGLFAENRGTIRNVHILSGDIDAGGNSFIAALVGTNYQDGIVEACSNGATVNGDASTYAGGLVGYNFGGKITDCYNTARVDGGGDSSSTGGIAGVNRQGGSITNCYNVGVVDSTGTLGAIVGGNEAVIANCYYLENGELPGIGNGDGVTLSRTADELSSSQMPALLAAGDDDTLWQGGTAGYAYPTHRQPGSAATAMDAISSLPDDTVAADAPEDPDAVTDMPEDTDSTGDVDASDEEDEWDTPTGEEPVEGVATYEG